MAQGFEESRLICLEGDYITGDLQGKMKLIEECMNWDLITHKYQCPKCPKQMKLRPSNKCLDGFAWICCNKPIHKKSVQRSVRCGSWFAISKLSMIKILRIIYGFTKKRSHTDIASSVGVSTNTITDWHLFFREVCMDVCLRENSLIGGPGVIVEIVECILGKRKFTEKKRSSEGWVLGGVEHSDVGKSGKCFMRVIKERDSETLVNIIKSSILPGTTIIWECWNSGVFSEEDSHELTVNHSLCFQDPTTGANTDGIWARVKIGKRSPNSGSITDLNLAEYMWFRLRAGTPDLLAAFIKDASMLYPPKCKDDQS